jgi:hypothetical protein
MLVMAVVLAESVARDVAVIAVASHRYGGNCGYL